MERTNLNLAQVRDKFDTAREWLQVRRRVLRFNTVTLLVIIGAIVAVMSVGALVQAIVQAHQLFTLVDPIHPILETAANISPVVGLIGLAVFSYFTNLSEQDDRRRELLVDALVLAMGFFVPLALFHIGWLATTHYIVTSHNYIITTEMLVNINLDWLLSIGLVIVNIALGWYLWRILRYSDGVQQQVDYVDADYEEVEDRDYRSRRVYE